MVLGLVSAALLAHVLYEVHSVLGIISQSSVAPSRVEVMTPALRGEARLAFAALLLAELLRAIAGRCRPVAATPRRSAAFALALTGTVLAVGAAAWISVQCVNAATQVAQQEPTSVVSIAYGLRSLSRSYVALVVGLFVLAAARWLSLVRSRPGSLGSRIGPFNGAAG